MGNLKLRLVVISLTICAALPSQEHRADPDTLQTEGVLIDDLRVLRIDRSPAEYLSEARLKNGDRRIFFKITQSKSEYWDRIVVPADTLGFTIEVEYGKRYRVTVEGGGIKLLEDRR